MKIIGKVPPWILLCLFALSHSTETAYTAALPSISNYFSISDSLAQITSSAYFAGFSLGILSLGRVSDIFGRRPVILIGTSLYIVSSLIIASLDDVWLLIFFRFVQAFGASVGSVVGQAMARDSYQGWQLSYIYASISMAMSFIPSLGSIVGGYIVEYLGWRHIFTFLGIVSALLLNMYIKYLPETNPYIGASRNNRYYTVMKIALSDKILLLYALIVGSFNGIMFGFYVEAPFIFIDTLEMKPSNYGKLAFCITLASLVGSILNRRLVSSHVSTNKIVKAGLTLSIIGCIALVGASFIDMVPENRKIIIFMIFIPMMLHMLGHSLVIPIALRYALEDYAKVTGTAGSVFGSLYYMCVAIISFTISKIHSETITKFTLLFFLLSATSSFAFYLIQKWHPIRKKFEFN